METPTPIKLQAKELAALRAAQDESEALQRFIDHMLNQGRLKQQKIQETAREAYRAIKARTGLDLENVAWAPDFEAGTLVPIQVKLVSQPKPQAANA